MNIFHAYRRVSDEKQEFGYSLDTQDSLLRKLHAEKYPGFHYMEYCDAAVSAFIPWFERKAGEALWTQITEGDVIAVATFDRAFRSLTDLCRSVDKLQERKVTLHCLDLPVDISTIEGQLVLKLLAVVKEYERKVISKRLKAINEWKRQNGLPLNGKRITGYKRHGRGRDFKWHPWKEEREFGQRLVVMHDADGMSFREMYYAIQRERNKGQLLEFSGSYGYLEDLYYATKEGFPLKDGSYIPAAIGSS